MRRFFQLWAGLMAVVFMGLASACGSSGGGGGGDEGSACDLANPTCPDGLICEAAAGDGQCLAPVMMSGTVVDLAAATPDDAPVEGAIVQAVDVNGASIGTSAITAPDGTYTLELPATRDVDGVPIAGTYTLRVQAASYQEFPTAIRPALPLEATTAVQGDSGWVINNALTTVGLIALDGDTAGLRSISGTVSGDDNAGVLVVAEGGGEAYTGYSDSGGEYTIFNVPAGDYTVQGYATGVQLDPTTVTVAAEAVTGIDLVAAGRPLNTVSGNVQIVNAPGEAVTSVVLAVEDTFVEAAGRGAVPPGLRIGEVAGDFTIDNVPDGRYVVLAAFENDDLVRDPDQSIGGTRTVTIDVPDPTDGNMVVLPESFKVTEALAVVGPGADGPETVDTATPSFEWADDSSEDGYTVRVFDAFGNEVWNAEIPSVSGLDTVTVTYAGPALEPGAFYQFRATSFRDTVSGRTAISTTEDLKGVFFLSSE